MSEIVASTYSFPPEALSAIATLVVNHFPLIEFRAHCFKPRLLHGVRQFQTIGLSRIFFAIFLHLLLTFVSYPVELDFAHRPALWCRRKDISTTKSCTDSHPMRWPALLPYCAKVSHDC